MATATSKHFQIISESNLTWELHSECCPVWRRKVLLSDRASSLKLVREDWEPEAPLCRFEDQVWEEILVLEGSLEEKSKVLPECYLILVPDEIPRNLKVGVGGAQLLRLAYDHRIMTDATLSSSQTYGKPSLPPVLTAELNWNEIPRRGSEDPGGRVAELSRHAAGILITTLMDCRPGWTLHEHEHPSEVIAYCIRGEGTLGVTNGRYSFQRGQLAVIPAGLPHHFRTGAQGAYILATVVG